MLERDGAIVCAFYNVRGHGYSHLEIASPSHLFSRKFDASVGYQVHLFKMLKVSGLLHHTTQHTRAHLSLFNNVVELIDCLSEERSSYFGSVCVEEAA